MISVVIMMAILLVNISGSLAQQVPFHWNHINVEIDVQENGDMLVTENQEYEFTADYTNHRYRYIPLEKVDGIQDVTLEENNLIIPSSSGVEGNQFWIRWQHKLKAPEVHRFVLKYRVIGGLHVSTQDTQVYWKAIFADREALVKNANVQVRLPVILANRVTSFDSFGVSSKSQAVDARTFIFTSNQPLNSGEKLEVKVVFPSGILNLPQPLWQQNNARKDWMNFGLWLVAPFSIIAAMIYRRCCPKCKKITLKRTATTIISPT